MRPLPLIVLLAAALGLSACARGHLQPFPELDDAALLERRFSVVELHQDIDAWFDGIALRHPDLASRLPAEDFAEAKAEAKSKIGRPMTRREFFRAVGDATERFRDGHSGLMYPYPEFDAHLAKGGKRFPLRLRWGADGLEVAGDVGSPTGIAVGSRVLRINQVPAEQLLARMARYARGESGRLREQIVIEEFDAWLWHVLGWEDRFEMEFSHQDLTQYRVLSGVGQSSSHVSVQDDAPRYRRLDARTGVLDVAYFDGDEDAFEEALIDAQRQAIEHAPQVLIVDLRRNPGGSTDAVEALLSRLTPRDCPLAAQVIEKRNRDNLRWWERESLLGRLIEDEDVPVVRPSAEDERFPGELRVLISAYTYSAAIVMATAAQDCGIGVLIGEETGGFANQTAQIHFFDLPHTRLRAFAPTRLVLRPSGERGALPVRPDHRIPTSAARLDAASDATLRFASLPDLPNPGDAP